MNSCPMEVHVTVQKSPARPPFIRAGMLAVSSTSYVPKTQVAKLTVESSWNLRWISCGLLDLRVLSFSTLLLMTRRGGRPSGPASER
jgi:hypothetical protein